MHIWNLNWKVVGLLLFLTLAWGMSYPITKIGIINLAPFTFSFLRFLIGSIVLLFIVWVRRKKVIYRRLPLVKIIILGIIQTSLLFGLTGVGIQFVDSGKTSVLLYTMPIWTSLLAVFFLHETIGFRKFVSLFIAFLGLVLLIGIDIFLSINIKSLIGSGLILLAALFWSIANIYFKVNFSDYDPLHVTAWQMALGCVVLGIFAWVFESGTFDFQWTIGAIWSIAYLGIIASSICFVIWYYLLQTIKVTTVALSSLFVPVFGIYFGGVFLNEPITIDIIIGTILLLTGVIIGQLSSDLKHKNE